MITRLLILLFLPVTVFATITATDRGTGSDNTSNSSVVVTPNATMTAGNTGIIVLAMDNVGGASSNLTQAVNGSYTDSVGNVWYVRSDAASGTASTTQELAILSCRLTSNFTTSNNLTITLTAASQVEAWTITEAAPSAGNVVAYETSAVGTTNLTGAPTINANFEPSNTDLIIGCGAAESADTWVGATDTLNGSWSTKQSTGAGTGTSGMSVISQSKVVNLYGVQTYAPTLTSVDTRLGWAIFAEADPKIRSLTGNNTSSTAISIPINFPMVAGSLGVLCISADNAAGTGDVTNFPSTLTDTASNVWTKRQNAVFDPGAAAAGVEFAIYTGALTTGLVVGNTVTGTFGTACIAKTWALWEFAPTGTGAVTYVTGAAGTGAASGTPTITTTSIASGNYVIAMGGAEGFDTWAGASYATNGTYKTQASCGKGTGAAAAMSVASQWKLTTAAATQTYDPTLTSADTILGWIEINDSSVLGPTGQQKAAFFYFFP